MAKFNEQSLCQKYFFAIMNYDRIHTHATITTKLRNVINVSLLKLKYILIISLRTGESASIFQ